MKQTMKLLPHLSALLLAIPVCNVSIAADVDSWPCEQAYVSEVSAAVVWDGPSIDGMAEEWRKHPEITEMVSRLTSRRADPNGLEPAIEDFAKSQPVAERDHELTLLFAGVLQTLNADRRKLNNGILRYAEDQQRRAEKLDADLVEMVRLESDKSDKAHDALDTLRKRVDIEQRVFDDRERTIPYLCTRPRAVEQKLGDIARAISYQLQ